MRRWTVLLISLALLALLAFAATAVAQTGGYDLSWWTVDSGGGSSSASGSYSLIGTVGQADAGGMSDGEFALYGGFWPGGVTRHTVYLPLVLRNQ